LIERRAFAVAGSPLAPGAHGLDAPGEEAATKQIEAIRVKT
jgi:hypothetical protein